MTDTQAAMREALEPFVREANRITPLHHEADRTVVIDDNCEVWQCGSPDITRSRITYGDLRRARAALATPQPEAGVEGLGEALFRLSARLKDSGFLDDDANHAAYEAVVAAFNSANAVEAKPWYETDAHRDLGRIIPDMEGKIAEAKTRYAHCIPDRLFAPLEASITELRVLRHELAAIQSQAQPEAPSDGEALREALERCASIVDRNLHRQNEKVSDVSYIARAALTTPADRT